ncbi:MAG: YggS family pyridoxal phosphate-dependent enzyme [Anaerolineae bacterium]|nr:YggS family pyridoxal phosphate-dependent enzyme [Anaerolineae bacterium]
MSELTANLLSVQKRIAAAAAREGRKAEDVTLVAVSKTHPLEMIIEAYQAGLRHFGENRNEELLDKRTAFAQWQSSHQVIEPIQWHFIGHVQSRQVASILESRPALLHSVDSIKLAERIDRLAQRENLPKVNILLQCNISGEERKSGFSLQEWKTAPHQLTDFLHAIEQMAALENVSIVGLMTMAPYFDEAEASRPFFQSLATLNERLKESIPQLEWRHLSMGMTNDFEVGIEEGATIVRVGRAIFGERQYT